jgi:protein-S-isoprenylcysteine O-methyltransferase Ste14
MLIHWHQNHFDFPLILSVLEWIMFSLYWSAAAKNVSRPLDSELSRSRRFHVTLVNIALLFVVLPVYGLIPRFLPDALWVACLGLSIQSASLALAVWARRHLAAHWSGEITIKVDHELIRSGPYRFVRHPIYASILGMYLGSAIVSGHVLAILGLTLAGFAYRRKILMEDANLRRAFGETYDIYQSQTGALLPRHRAGGH